MMKFAFCLQLTVAAILKEELLTLSIIIWAAALLIQRMIEKRIETAERIAAAQYRLAKRH